MLIYIGSGRLLFKEMAQKDKTHQSDEGEYQLCMKEACLLDWVLDYQDVNVDVDFPDAPIPRIKCEKKHYIQPHFRTPSLANCQMSLKHTDDENTSSQLALHAK